ncbi:MULTISPECIES: CaiB/BaiF CoA transferase family protein [unclassified Rhodococcus (in: high G+C Gram-positive bacteria)]|jgi:crotonobetainyl-CoA:carnitine CoA-transferase CaiB-like acyl-CoA transferase|uniref:CaiB/BaiF CoA transferase family protein n=1 Tax=unclassified Rhodococcus (in: high G+C Gram-positive bacteria) TaxID=192944 RepID=UPI000318EE51|nr:CaiB/BaiF CoA-transferase family protein [Rhodococcus sp. DK17]
MAAALENLHIVDFSRILAGPFATMLLGDLGATVTKIERPGVGDDTRSWGPPYDDSNEATYFQSINRNKTSVTIDLASSDGIEMALKMATHADVVVENFRPGVMDKLGLGYEVLRELNPGLVYCSITGFGRDGGSHLRGYDLLLQAVGGLMSITGQAGGEPQKVGVALVDVLAGLYSTVGILSAVRFREASGLGQRVEVDLLSSLLGSLVNEGAAFTSGGVIPTRKGNAHPGIAPCDLIPTADRELAVAVATDSQFAALCESVRAQELVDDPRFETNSARVDNRLLLRNILIDKLRDRTATEWADDLATAGVPAAAVNNIPAAFDTAEQLGLAPIVQVARSDGTVVNLPRNPISLSKTPPTYRMAPPSLQPEQHPLSIS